MIAQRRLTHSFSLLHIDCVELGRKWNYQNVISPYYRIYYIDKGKGKIFNGNETLVLAPGFLYMIPSFTLCSMSCDDYLHQYFVQFFEESADGISLFTANRKLISIPATERHIENFKRLLAINPNRGINRSDNPKVYEKENYYDEYQRLNDLQRLPIFFETQGLILQLVAAFLTSETAKTTGTSIVPSRMMDAVSYIQLNLAKPLTLTQLAARANLHPDYFSRIFKEYVGVRPITFIQQKRIERAQYLLATTNLPYSKIAMDTGFDNIPYFSRIFKLTTGLTPGQYKKQIYTSQV